MSLTTLMARIKTLSLETLAAILAVCTMVALLLAAALRVFGVPWPVAAAVAVALGAAGAVFAIGRVPPSLRALTDRGWVRAAYLLLLAVTVVQTARLSLFIADSKQPQHSMLPSSPWIVSHSCATAYYEAARLMRDERPANIYDGELYAPGGKYRFVAGLKVDNYEYSPAFLLAPRALLSVSSDYPRFRALWGLLVAVSVLAALLAVVLWLPPAAGRRAALTAPLVVAALPTLITLQINNVHVAMIALGVLAMIAIERDHRALGGTLLGFSILSKISPGILVVYLLCRRQWGGVLWTAGASLALLVLSLLVFGADPWTAFLFHHLPRLETGAAFPPLLVPASALGNHSIPGLLYKLKAMGVLTEVSVPLTRAIGWLYTAGVVAVTVVFSRKPLSSRLQRVCLWLVLLTLGGMRSVFLPITYATYAPLWLAALLTAARDAGRGFTTAAAVTVAGLALIYVPSDASRMSIAIVSTATHVLTWVAVGLGLALVSRAATAEPASIERR
jgi:hypothetical protein